MAVSRKTPAVEDDRPPPRKPSARSSARARRSAARLAAVQILYQAAIAGQDLGAALKEFADYRIGQILEDIELVAADRETLDSIIGGLIQFGPQVDEAITGAFREGMDPTRLELLLRCILRAGTTELLVRRDVETGVIISDYLSVTDSFYGKTEVRLINGILDAIAKLIRLNNDAIYTEL